MKIIKYIILNAACMLVIGNVLFARQTIADPRKFDEFQGSGWEDAMARLDNFTLDLRNNPNAIGVLIIYGGQHGRRGETRAWTRCVRRYLVNRRGTEANRILIMDGGYREQLTVELWETPDKHYLPKPGPHVKPHEVKFKKGVVKSLCNI
jgi:hypothetical protein